jgi:hypothetical protein
VSSQKKYGINIYSMVIQYFDIYNYRSQLTGKSFLKTAWLLPDSDGFQTHRYEKSPRKY